MKPSDLLFIYIFILIIRLYSVFPYWSGIGSSKSDHHVKKSGQSSHSLESEEVEFLTTSKSVSRQERSLSTDSIYNLNWNKLNARNGQYLIVAPMYSICCCLPQTYLVPANPAEGGGGGGSPPVGSLPAGPPASVGGGSEGGGDEEGTESEEDDGSVDEEEEGEEEEVAEGERRNKQRRLKKGKKRTKYGAQIRKVTQKKTKRLKRKPKPTKRKSSTLLPLIV